MKRAGEWKKAATQVEAKGSSKVVETAGDGENEFLTYAESLISTTPVRWGNIGGLEEVKRLMKETVVIAFGLKRPESIKPWKGSSCLAHQAPVRPCLRPQRCREALTRPF